MNIKNFVKKSYFGVRRFFLKIIRAPDKLPELKAPDVRSLLCVRVDRIGDLVVTLSALKALKNIFVNAKITVLAAQANSTLLKAVPWIDEVIAYRRSPSNGGFINPIEVVSLVPVGDGRGT